MTAPERIWATINGASTRIPDGGRQLIGGWSQDRDRPRAVEYVRADLYAALEAQLAETRKALEIADAFFRCIRFDRDRDTFAAEAVDAIRAARRVLEGGGDV